MVEINKVHEGDCLDLFKQLDDESIDLIVSDPPYKVHKRSVSGLKGLFAKDITKQGNVFTYNDIDIEDYLDEFYRVLKVGSHCYIMSNGCNFLHFLDVIRESKFNFCRMLIWDKRNLITNQYYMSGFEYIFFLYKESAKPINNMGCSDILRFANKKDKDYKNGGNLHDSQKPVSLFQCMVENSSNIGDVVLDPFCGSGTLPLACIRAKRNWIGFEIDPKYVELSNKRIEIERSKLTLF